MITPREIDITSDCAETMRTVYYRGIPIQITPFGCLVRGKMYNGIGEAKKAALNALKGK